MTDTSKQLIVLDGSVAATKTWTVGGRVEMVHIPFAAGGENHEIVISVYDWQRWREALDNAKAEPPKPSAG